MGGYVADQLIKLMTRRAISPVGARVLVLGLAFKENCPDVRNTKVVDIVRRLAEYHVDVDVHDPWVSAKEAQHEYGLQIIEAPETGGYDAVVLAVGHAQFIELGAAGARRFGRGDCVLYDVKSVYPRDDVDGRL